MAVRADGAPARRGGGRDLRDVLAVSAGGGAAHVEEVSDALTFTMDNAARLCPGASAGAWCSWSTRGRAPVRSAHAQARRARDNRADRRGRRGWLDARGSRTKRRDAADESARRPRPRAFVGLCGVYDIDTHYKYEDSRGSRSCLRWRARWSDRASTARRPCGWCAPTNAVAYDQMIKRRVDAPRRRKRRQRPRAMTTGFCRTTTKTTRDARTIQTASLPMSLSIPSGTLKTISCGARTGRPRGHHGHGRTFRGEIVARARWRRPGVEKENAREKENDAGETDTRRRNGSRPRLGVARRPRPTRGRLRRRRGGEAGGVRPASRKRFSRPRENAPGVPSRVPARRVPDVPCLV